jgi:hypothetical protein
MIRPKWQKSTICLIFKNVAWYELMALLPAFILFAWGGALGVMIGMVGWSLTLKVMRSQWLSRGK